MTINNVIPILSYSSITRQEPPTIDRSCSWTIMGVQRRKIQS